MSVVIASQVHEMVQVCSVTGTYKETLSCSKTTIHNSSEPLHSYSIDHTTAAAMKTFGALTLSILLGGINGLVIREDGINYTIEGLELLNTTSSVDKRANYEFKE
jgi:hypothetical protein